MMRVLAICVLLACFTCQGAATIGQEQPSRQIPELKVLENYVGAWDVEMLTKELPFTKGKAEAKWVLDGRYVQQTGELHSNDGTAVVSYMALMTYDPDKKVYRAWNFLSDGNTGESEGTWDANRKIMKSISPKDANGGFTTTTADFSQAGVEMWTITYTDRTGQVVSEMKGKNSRRER